MKSFMLVVLDKTVDLLIGIVFGAAFLIIILHAAASAPEFSAIVLAGALIALAIYKRPPARIEQRFEVSELTMERVEVRSDVALALKVLDELRQAAEQMPEEKKA